MTENPSTTYLNPFVVDEPVRTRLAEDGIDWYLPDEGGPRPAVVFVHGGPIRPDMSPKDWPVYVGYASMAARLGVVGVAFNHPFHGIEQMSAAAREIDRVLELVRADDRVDSHRIGLWAFSGAGLFAGRFVAGPPEWLRAVALSYPDCRRDDDDPDWPMTLAEAIEHSSNLPILLTRVGREDPELAAAVDEFVGAADGAAANLTIIDVPDGEHAFDILEPTIDAQAAVDAAMTWMVDALAG